MTKKILLGFIGLSITLFANSYDDFIEELSTDMGTYMKDTQQRQKQMPIKKAKVTHSSSEATKKLDKQIKEVKKSNQALAKEVKQVKHEVKKIEKTVKVSNAALVEEVKKSNKTLIKEVKKSSSYKQGKEVIPVAMINETPTSINKNSFLYVGFGFQGLTVEDDNGYFGVNALDDSALDIKAGYGQYFNVGDTKLFATGGFEFLSLKQADMKAITASINTQTVLDEDITAYIGIKTGFSYLVWDIAQDEAVESITSTSPLVGIQVGIEYQFNGGFSLVLGGEYTKYFHETQIPNDILNTSSGYGVNISLKFYQ